MSDIIILKKNKCDIRGDHSDSDLRVIAYSSKHDVLKYSLINILVIV